MSYSIKNDVQILGLTILGNYTSAERTSLSLVAGDAGGLVFDTTTLLPYFWTGSNWETFNGTANLSFGTITATQIPLNIDTGTDVVFQSATATLAGLMSAPDKVNHDALVVLDGVAPGATDLGTFTGTIIPDNQTIKSAFQSLETSLETFQNSAGQPNGLATLDGAGTIPTSQLPALAITDVYVVADITARDALTVQEGDVAKVTDSDGNGNPQTYIYDGTVWVDIQETSDVISINGFTGVVILEDDDIAYDDTPAPIGSPLDGATNVENALNALNNAIDTINNTNNKFIQTFVVADWVGPTSGRYTFSVTQATHGLTAADLADIQVQELISANNYRVVQTQIDVNTSTGEVLLTVRSSPDSRFDGRVIITQDH